MPNSLQSWVLLAADTDRTQEYVFESSRLPELRGASRLVDDAVQSAGRQVVSAGGEVIFSGGGNLLAFVPQAVAAGLAKGIEAQFVAQTKTATITASWRPVTPQMLEKGCVAGSPAPFGSLMEWASLWLRRAKDERDLTPWIEALPFVERCRSCQLRPADPHLTQIYPDWPLCTVCHHKRSYTGRYAWFQRFQDYLQSAQLERGYYGDQSPFADYNRSTDGPRPSPQDLNEIGQACGARPGYIGLIYLDGDGFGGIFSEVETSEHASALSEAIEQTANQAVMASLAEHVHPFAVIPSDARKGTEEECDPSRLPGGRLLIHPFEILAIGGDDILLIVPADQAIPIACQISQKFQELLQYELKRRNLPGKYLEHPMTLSGGVVLASDHNPVRVLHELAKELKSSAKQARNRQKAAQGFLDYVVLMGTEMPDRNLEDSRKLYPYVIQGPNASPLSLLARPFSASSLAEVWGHLQRLKGDLANSQMSQLAEAALKGMQESRLHYLYQRKRIHGYGHLDAALEILLGRKESELPSFPWFEYEQQKPSSLSAQTALWDIAELYTWVPARRKELHVQD